MKGTQRVILIVGLLVTAVCGLFPPWVAPDSVRNADVYENAGYSFILKPPEGAIRLDYQRLLIQWASVSAITSALWLAVGGMRRHQISTN